MNRREPQPRQALRLRTTISFLCATALAAPVVACEAPADVQKSPFETSAATLPGLSENERARFQEGAGEFSEVETIAEGLGPFFNGSSCAHCHSGSGLGTSGVLRVTRFVCRTPSGELEVPPSGTVLHVFSTRPDIAGPGIPEGCDAVLAERRTTNGVEREDERRARGKPASGRVSFKAVTRGNMLSVSVHDDGAGIAWGTRSARRISTMRGDSTR